MDFDQIYVKEVNVYDYLLSYIFSYVFQLNVASELFFIIIFWVNCFPSVSTKKYLQICLRKRRKTKYTLFLTLILTKIRHRTSNTRASPLLDQNASVNCSVNLVLFYKMLPFLVRTIIWNLHRVLLVYCIQSSSSF